MSGYWKVNTLSLSSDGKRYGLRTHYLFTVEGTKGNGESFIWTVPDISNPDYDISNAYMDADTAGALLAVGCFKR